MPEFGSRKDCRMIVTPNLMVYHHFPSFSLVCSTVYSILRHTWHTQLCQFKCKSDVSKTRNRNCYRKQASEPKNIGHRRFGESEHAFRSVGIGPWHFVSELSTQSSLWFWIGFSKNRIAIQIIINPTGYQWFINGFIIWVSSQTSRKMTKFAKAPTWPSLPPGIDCGPMIVNH